MRSISGPALAVSLPWAGAGKVLTLDEVTGIIADRDRLIRSAVWSPSGINEMGGVLLVVLSNHGVASVHTPQDDPYNQEYKEASPLLPVSADTQIADLSVATMEVLGDGEIEEGIPTLKGMLRMRKTSLEWSPPVPLPSMIGIDGSLLALGNRAGWVELWSYDGAFSHQLAAQLPRPFATELTWSAWQVVDDETCAFDNVCKPDPGLTPGVAQLAAATTDGAVNIIPVTRRADAESGTWDVTVGGVQTVFAADKRTVNTIKWITVSSCLGTQLTQNDTLVWTKPGSVSIWSTSWNAPKTVRLERVGNWAGCNALGQAMGRAYAAAPANTRHPLRRTQHPAYRPI